MNLYYNGKTETWYTTEEHQTFGYLEETLSVEYPDPSHTSFNLAKSENNLGPLVGIMISRNKQNKLIGNEALINGLQKEVNQIGGMIILFPPEWVNSDYVNGFIYCTVKSTWLFAKAPLPNVVYNRIPFRQKEKHQAFYQACSILQTRNIPFFNPSFLNKWELYQLLSTEKRTQDYLPKTFLLKSYPQLLDIIDTYKNVYIKPLEGHKGQDITRIRKTQDNYYLVSSTKQSETLSTLENLWEEKWQSKPFLIQEEVKAALYQGNRYDFRLLVHFMEGNYRVSGIGVRQSERQDITTHIPSGGKLLPYENIAADSHHEIFQTLAENCGILLSSHYGFFGEFSIDATVDKEGNYFLFEINAKPMLFDEPHIEKTRCHKLAHLFFELTNFPVMRNEQGMNNPS